MPLLRGGDGALVEVKGHEFLIRAMADLSKTQTLIECDILGDGPQRGKLEELAAFGRAIRTEAP